MQKLIEIQRVKLSRVKLVAPQALCFFVGADSVEGLCLNLADALAGNAKLFAYLLKRVVNAVFEPVAQLEDLALFRAELVEDLAELVAQDAARDLLVWGQNFVVFYKVAKHRLAIIVVGANGALQGNSVLVDLLDLVNFFNINAHLKRNLLGQWVAAQVLA